MRELNFMALQERLTADLRLRVQRGEITERGLARVTGVSQPHIHHVLSGRRSLSPEMADRIMGRLGMNLLDLMEAGELLEWRSRH